MGDIPFTIRKMTALFDIRTFKGRYAVLLTLVIISLYMPFGINSLFIMLFLLNSFIRKRPFHDLSKPRAGILASGYVLLFATYALSLFYTEEMDVGLMKIETRLSFLFMPFGLISGYHLFDRKFTKYVLNVFVFVSVAAALISLGRATYLSVINESFYATITDDGVVVPEYYFTYIRLGSLFMHPGYFSLYIGTAIFMAVHLYNKREMWISGKKGLLVIALLCIFLFLLQGRINLLAFLAIGFLASIFYYYSSGRYWMGTALAVGPILLLMGIIYLAPESISKRFTEFQSMEYQIDAPVIHEFNGFTIRLAEWKCAMEVIEESPILGHGIGDYKTELLRSYERNNFVVGLRREFNAHNQFLESHMAIGIIGPILLLGLLFYMLFLSFRLKKGLLAAVSSYLFLSMITESILERHWAITLFCIVPIFLIFSAIREDEQNGVDKAEE